MISLYEVSERVLIATQEQIVRPLKGHNLGILYTVWDLDEEMRAYLDELGIPTTDGEPSRKPLFAEIVSTLNELANCSSTITDNGIGHWWGAMIQESVADDGGGMWTLLTISRRAPSNQPQNICFEKGWPELILQFLCILTLKCGVLVLLADCGGDPLVIRPGDDPLKLLDSWQLS